MITSKLYTADARDLVHSLIAAIAGAVWAIVAPNVMEIITSNGKTGFILDWVAIWHTAIATGILFLIHRFLKPQQQITTVK